MSRSSVFASCLCIAGLSVSGAQEPSFLAIVGVGVVDVVGGTVLPDRTVIISGDRIERIAGGVAPLPDNASGRACPRGRASGIRRARRGLVNPTLIAGRRVNAWLAHPDDPRDKYLPASGWREAADTIKSLRQDAVARLAERRPAWREMEGVVGDLHRAGVRLVTGTDLAHFLIHPGFSLHDELQALVEAGLTPTEAVRAATLHPAALFPHLDAGEVAPGKHASLVLLDANPLDDIRHTARIRAVIAGGRLYDGAALERLLGEAVALAAVN